MRHRSVHIIAKTLCECDGKDWATISSTERDRYARVAILIDHRVATDADFRSSDPASRVLREFEVGSMETEGSA